jgi:hypothetical protein
VSTTIATGHDLVEFAENRIRIHAVVGFLA